MTWKKPWKWGTKLADKFTRYAINPEPDQQGGDKFSKYSEQYQPDSPSKGFSGVGEDIASSLQTLPSALIEMIYALPGELSASGQQIVNKPSRAASNLAGSALSGLRFAGNIPHNSREYLLEKEIPFSTNNPYPKFEPSGIESYLLKGNEPGDTLLRGIGEFIVPFSRVGAGMKGAKGLSTRAGGVGALAVGSDEMNPIHAAFMGMLGEGVGSVAKKGSQSFLNKTPLANKNEVAIKGIEPSDVKENIEASRRLGLKYITPGEASGFGYIGKQEGRIGNTLEGSKLREKNAKERMSSEEKVITNFLDKLDDKIELPKEKQALYESVLNQTLPSEFMGRFIIDNPVVESAMNLAGSKPAYKQRLKNVDVNSFRYWDEIKRILYDMESAEKRKGKNNLADSITDVRKELIKTMDDIDPNYVKARKLGQRTILRREIEEGFDKKDMTGNNFYKNVIQSKSNFDKLYNDLSEFPDMQQQLMDMKTVFPNIMGTANAKATAAGERGGYTTPRTPQEWLLRFLKQQFNEAGDVNAVKQITSSDWYERMKGNPEAKSSNLSPEVINKFAEYLVKSMAANSEGESK